MVFCRWTRRHGVTRAEAASRIGVSPGLVKHWERRWRRDRCPPWPRGRPVGRLDGDLRNQIMDTIDVHGPSVGIRPLQALFPQVPRRDLEELLQQYRQDYPQQHPTVVHTLTWSRPGAVWTMDYTDPPTPVDGVYKKILLVRDLASGQQLAALPVEQEGAQTTRNALLSLFKEHGAPLVLKSDNGSPVVARAVRALLQRHAVLLLVSPPSTPEYNGGCEAGIGALKTRAHHQAARRGYPGEWTCCDVETARVLANRTARPHGHRGPSPEDVWEKRVPISMTERRAFRGKVDAFEKEELNKAIDHARKRSTVINAHQPNVLTRRAIRRALVELDYLVIRRKRIPLPIKTRSTVNIT